MKTIIRNPLSLISLSSLSSSLKAAKLRREWICQGGGVGTGKTNAWIRWCFVAITILNIQEHISRIKGLKEGAYTFLSALLSENFMGKHVCN